MRRLAPLALFLSISALVPSASTGAETKEDSDDRASAAKSAEEKNVVIVQVPKVHVYAEADKKSKRKFSLDEFTPVEVLGANGSWKKVKTKGGATGYVPASSLARSAFVSASGKITNVREGPDRDDRLVFTLKNHYPLRVLDRAASRVKVVDYEGDSGWVHENYLSTKSYVIVTGIKGRDTINVREGPGVKHAFRFEAPKGYYFEVLEEKDGWLHVKCPDGDEGWCSAKLVWGYLEP
ncbi:MAG TPA: SH3 domain-containing protein [Sumerlaeia bacterium]|nr:SH3 domain-containing protein [Sumerlaeia bacterium]